MAGETERRADIAFLFFHNQDQHSFYPTWLTLQGRAEDQKKKVADLILCLYMSIAKIS